MKKIQKTMTLRVRCEPSLKTDIETVARLRMLDSSDIVRIACAEFIQQQFKNRALKTVGN